MDDFREWLSDNLRYFMLGGGILLIVVILFFGVRAFLGNKEGNPEDEDGGQQVIVTDEGQEDVPSSPTKDGETDEKKDANPMETGSAEIKALITSYYKALGEKDIATLRTLVDSLAQSDESKIANAKDYIEGYEVSEVYTKKGLTEDSYVVYANFYYICKGVTTKVPALSQFYVFKDAGGSWKIDGAADENAGISSYTEELRLDEDVQSLTSRVKEDYEKAQETDPQLAAFLDGLGEEAAATAAEETSSAVIMVTTTGTNVRAQADSSSQILGVLEAGAEVEKTGEEGEWTQVSYQGQTAYIFTSLLTEKTAE